jgi:hypothetical protein
LNFCPNWAANVNRGSLGGDVYFISSIADHVKESSEESQNSSEYGGPESSRTKDFLAHICLVSLFLSELVFFIGSVMSFRWLLCFGGGIKALLLALILAALCCVTISQIGNLLVATI